MRINNETNAKIFTPKILSISAALVAIGTLTQYIKFFRMPMGGSVTLFSMMFIAAIGWMFGPVVGALGGLTYSFMQIIFDLYVVHPVQFAIDYLFAFVALGAIAGFYKNFNAGYIMAVLARYFCHVISGYFFFWEYLPDDFFLVPYMSGAALDWAYSLIYNATYILPEAVITVIILTVPAVKNALLNLKKTAVTSRPTGL
jgi:thiamine transporter